MNNFIFNYLSILATVSSLVVGVPLSLWVNQKLVAYTQDLRNQEESKRLSIAFEALEHSLNSNIKKLNYLVNILNENKIFIFSGLDVSSWDAVKLEIEQYHRKTTFNGVVAFYFSQLSSLNHIIVSYRDYFFGMNSALANAKETQIFLRAQIIEQATQLNSDAQVIIHHIQILKNKHILEMTLRK